MNHKTLFICAIVASAWLSQAETLKPLTEGKAPQTHTELWQGYDPRAEPLDVEVLKEWQEDGVVLRVVRFRVGEFKGKKSMIAGVYGFPKNRSSEKVPGLVNIHGGGQYADYRSVLTNARRGYATVTIAWAGRISAPGHNVGPNEVKLFWKGKTDAPNYRKTTDWGALDAYHAPSRNGKDAFATIPAAADWTLDPVKSPRNSAWFLATMAARRALTFLEQQPEADANKLGVYGHSMGGKLSVQTAGSDSRVKAAAPSCGGISDRYNDDPLHRQTVGDSTALQKIQCPTIFLSPSNDFHGHINDLVLTTKEIGSNPWRVTCSPHLNHRDLPEYEVATQLWFDQYLKGTFTWPATPTVQAQLKTAAETPLVRVVADSTRPVLAVDVYYTQQGHEGGARNLRENRINRFWHSAATRKVGNHWEAETPAFSTHNPIWVYANVTYALDQPISGAGYYYGDYTTDKFVVSSLVQLIHPTQLKDAGVAPTLSPSAMIETFAGDWKKQWYSHNQKTWDYRTHKVYHPLWAAPKGARLKFDILAQQANTFVVGIDQFAAAVEIKPNDKAWQTVSLAPSDFKNAVGEALTSWAGIKELRLLPTEHLNATDPNRVKVRKLVGKVWQGPEPQLRNLQWSTSALTGKLDIAALMPHAEDRTAMWWRDGFPGKTENADWRRMVQAGKYWFLFDTDTMAVARLGAAPNGLTKVKGADLKLQMTVDGKDYRCVQGGGWSRFEGPRLIESGRFLQRADVTGLVFKADDGSQLNVDARFEAAAWSDQLAMSLAARPGVQPIASGEASFGRVNGGYGLVGDNQFVITPTKNTNSPTFTLDFWTFVPINYQAGEAGPWLVCNNNHEESDGNYGILLQNEAIPEVTINIGGGRKNIHRASADKRGALRLDQWNHLSLSYDSKMLRLYVNGRKAIELAVNKDYQPQTSSLTIGNRGDQSGDGMFRYRGVIDQIRFYSQALADSQVDHLYRNPEPGLPVLKPTNEWTFRKQGQTAMSRANEQWNSASMSLELTNEKGKLENRWELPAKQSWHRKTWHETAIRFDPINMQSLPDTCEISVAANEVATGNSRPVTFEPSIGWHRINLDGIQPITPTGVTGPSNDSIERVKLLLSNPTKDEKIARLMFEKRAHGFEQKIGVPITGISAMLRDSEGNPIGIPVQLSKNWHYHPEDTSVHSGQWFHGVSQVRMPARESIELELTIAYGHWGGVAAASHGQLSLIGWGGNQRWDQSAIGSWGESICYSPEQNEASCTITDVRPMMVSSTHNKGSQWHWTKNVGGGDFLRLFDPSGKRIQRSGIVADYQKQCPCLTEVQYSGGMRGANIHHSQVVSVSRTNDLVCGTYQIHMLVNEPVDFSRFAIFQIGSDQYATTQEKKLAVGNENGLGKEWTARWGGNTYQGEAIECNGRIPWASLHESEGNPRENSKPGAWANRGFVIRKWQAKLGGKEVKPWIAEWGLQRGNFQTSLLEVVPPPGLKRLEPGDYITATIEHLIIPQYAKDYYGPNPTLQAALAKDANTWKMTHRQAIGDDVQVEMKSGQLLRLYPDVRVSLRKQQAEFTIQGGLGYVPITFTNLASHRDYSLTIDGQLLDQSVHGNDFWQTDFDAKNRKWSRTYNIPTTPGKAHTVQFIKVNEQGN